MNEVSVQNKLKSYPIPIPKSNTIGVENCKTCICKNTHDNDTNAYLQHGMPNHNRAFQENCIQDITLNLFDPNKCSPPNSWNSRLRARILNM